MLHQVPHSPINFWLFQLSSSHSEVTTCFTTGMAVRNFTVRNTLLATRWVHFWTFSATSPPSSYSLCRQRNKEGETGYRVGQKEYQTSDSIDAEGPKGGRWPFTSFISFRETSIHLSSQKFIVIWSQQVTRCHLKVLFVWRLCFSQWNSNKIKFLLLFKSQTG